MKNAATIFQKGGVAYSEIFYGRLYKATPKTEITKNVIEIKQRISGYRAKQKGNDIPHHRIFCQLIRTGNCSTMTGAFAFSEHHSVVPRNHCWRKNNGS